jgi:hypothetical protein
MSCKCGRYEWPGSHCLDGAHTCRQCGAPVSANAADRGDEPRTYYRDPRGVVWRHPAEGWVPMVMRPSEFIRLPEWEGV